MWLQHLPTLLSQLHTRPRGVSSPSLRSGETFLTYSWALPAPAVPSPVESPTRLLQALFASLSVSMSCFPSTLSTILPHALEQ